MARLYVLGGRQRNLLLKSEKEWNLYEAALILEIDTESKEVRARVEYKTPLEASAGENASVVFKSGTLAGDLLYACTSTEVLVFGLPEFRRTAYVSLPCFNDLHHVTPSSDGALLAANTGLDMVVKFTCRGELLDAWNVLQESPWSRFSASTDYRKVETTKPHRSHPNYVFELGGQLWVTRFRQCDAICLSDDGKRIAIPAQFPHDGLLHGEQIYFTSVDGKVVTADSRTLKVERIVDLQEISGGESLLGWCRGLLVVDTNRVWVGFTRIRKTRFHENILWLRNVVREGMKEKPTHIALYDLSRRLCLEEFDLEAHGMNIVFSIFPAATRAEKLFPH
jgi:hypothetical protein